MLADFNLNEDKFMEHEIVQQLQPELVPQEDILENEPEPEPGTRIQWHQSEKLIADGS